MVAELFGSLTTRGGYTPAEVWEMDFDDAIALLDYWGHTPPMRELVSVIAQMLGWEPSSRPALVEGNGALVEDIPGEFED